MTIRVVLLMSFICSLGLNGLSNANAQSNQIAMIPPTKAEIYKKCAVAFCPNNPSRVFFATACAMNPDDAQQEARNRARDAAIAAGCPMPPYVANADCPVNCTCPIAYSMTEMKYGLGNIPFATVPCWEIEFECCCRDGITLVTSTQGLTFCQAYNDGIKNAHAVASMYHGGACRCTYRITHRPCCQVCP